MVAMEGRAGSANYRRRKEPHRTERRRYVILLGFSCLSFDDVAMMISDEISLPQSLGDKGSLLKHYYSARSDSGKKGTLRAWKRK